MKKDDITTSKYRVELTNIESIYRWKLESQLAVDLLINRETKVSLHYVDGYWTDPALISTFNFGFLADPSIDQVIIKYSDRDEVYNLKN